MKRSRLLSLGAVWALVCLTDIREARAQAAPPDGQPTLCGQPLPEPAQLPPDGSGPVVYYIGLCFSAQGNVSSVDSETYLYYIKPQPSRPSRGEWIPYDEAADNTAADRTRRGGAAAATAERLDTRGARRPIRIAATMNPR